MLSENWESSSPISNLSLRFTGETSNSTCKSLWTSSSWTQQTVLTTPLTCSITTMTSSVPDYQQLLISALSNLTPRNPVRRFSQHQKPKSRKSSNSSQLYSEKESKQAKSGSNNNTTIWASQLPMLRSTLNSSVISTTSMPTSKMSEIRSRQLVRCKTFLPTNNSKLRKKILRPWKRLPLLSLTYPTYINKLTDNRLNAKKSSEEISSRWLQSYQLISMIFLTKPPMRNSPMARALRRCLTFLQK